MIISLHNVVQYIQRYEIDHHNNIIQDGVLRDKTYLKMPARAEYFVRGFDKNHQENPRIARGLFDEEWAFIRDQTSENQSKDH